MSQRHPPGHRIADLFTVVGFALVLGLPPAAFLVGRSPESQIVEQRAPVERPEFAFTLDSLRSFPRRYQAYYGDQFGFRGLLIRWNNIVTVYWLGTSPTVRVAAEVEDPSERPSLDLLSRRLIVGEDSWLFFLGPHAMDDLRGIDLMSHKILEDWRRLLEGRRDWLREAGIYYLFAVVPDKQTVYPEKLPGYVRRVSPQTRIDQFLTYMRNHSDLEVLDLRPALRRAKRSGPVYYRTETHWNEYGAYVAYRAIMTRVAQTFPELAPFPLSEFDLEVESEPGRVLASLLGLSDLIAEQRITLHPNRPRLARTVETREQDDEAGRFSMGSVRVLETDRRDLPRAVFFHDSFTRTHLDSFLSEHFRRSAYHWSFGFHPAVVRAEHPDLVLEIRVERLFTSIYPKGPAGGIGGIAAAPGASP